MSQKGSRWFIKVVLALGTIVFVGFSMLPLFESLLKESQPIANPTPTVSQTPLAKQNSQLVNEVQSYQVVLQQEPNNQTALRGLAKARIDQGNLEAAIAPLEKLIALEPNRIEYYVVLGQVYATQQNFEQAIAAYDRAIKIAPQDHRPVWAKALVLQQQGNTSEAKSLLEQAVALAPDQYKDIIKQQITQQEAQKPSPSPTAK